MKSSKTNTKELLPMDESLFKPLDKMEIPDPSNSFQHKFDQNLNQLKVKNTRGRFRYLYLAAAMIATLFIIYTLTPTQRGYDSIYREYHRVNSVFSSVNQEASSTNFEYITALEAYVGKDYRIATDKFLVISKKNPAWLTPHLYIAVSQMELKNYPLAIDHLQWVIGQNREYKRDAQWFLGLSYLKTREIQKAIDCFERLSTSEGVYQDSSVEVLALIDSVK